MSEDLKLSDGQRVLFLELDIIQKKINSNEKLSIKEYKRRRWILETLGIIKK
jgi:hypothetical protein